MGFSSACEVFYIKQWYRIISARLYPMVNQKILYITVIIGLLN
jgi:hypothetical protein